MLGLKLYQISFLDHVRDDDKPLTCHVVGWLIKTDRKSYTVSSWVTDSPKDTFDNNLELFCILKSAVIDIYEIELSEI